MELRLARAFVTVAEELHFGRAAARLRITQPALSRQIRALERELGVRLFERDSRAISLASAGAALLPEVQQLLAQADHAAAVARAAGRARRAFTIGFLAQAAAEQTTQLLDGFSRRCPQITVRLLACRFSDQLAQLHDATLDAALLRPPYDRDELTGLRLTTLSQEPRVAVLPAGHPLADGRDVSITDLVAQPWARMPAAVSAVWRSFWQADDHRGGVPATLSDEEVDNVEELLALVATGRALALTHAGVSRFYARPTLAFVPVRDLAPSALALAVPEARWDTPPVRALRAASAAAFHPAGSTSDAPPSGASGGAIA